MNLDRHFYNFSSGPATLPKAVYERICSDWENRSDRVALLEMSHRSDEFIEIADRAEKILIRLLKIPNNYVVLFLPGGASAQYAMVPLNLARDNRPLDYFNSGYWSRKSIDEAQRYGHVNLVAEIDKEGELSLPDLSDWQFSNHAAYCHFVDNETLTGFEFPPDYVNCDCPLVSDMTSNFLTRPFDIERFGMVYAGVQKNVGIAGISVVVIREDLLGMQKTFTPTLYSYSAHAEASSRYNTPPIFAWYVCSVMLEWIERQGGIGEMYQRSFERAQRLYGCIDSSAIYENSVAKPYRSRMNVHFRIKPTSLEKDFVERAEQEGLFGLRGHRATGGIRASLYNGMTLEGINALTDFMQDFEKHL